MNTFQKLEYIVLYVGSFFVGYAPDYQYEFLRFIMTVCALVVGGGLAELLKIYIRKKKGK